ncbi:MAG TPA: hypothetical protein VJ483_03135, partial [Holophagaceae bacterium]|nr:hypothetical protein [Holophagaceae bacterium]
RFQKAEVAYLGWNDEAALEACRPVLKESPWRYEAWQLQFRVWKRRADRLASQGDLSGRDAAIREADEALAQTLSVARCDPQVLVEQADWVLEKTGLGMKTEAAKLLEETLAICDRALAIDPTNLRALQRRSEAHWRTSSDLRDSGQDFTGHMNLAIADGETAVRLAPKDGRARLILGRALLLKVQQQLLRGGTDEEALARASEELDAAQRLAASDDVALPMTLSYARYLQAEAARQRGLDPRGFLRQAVEASESFAHMSPNDPSACGGLGELLKESAMAERRAGGDPAALLQRSQASFERGVAVAPGSAQLLKDLGSVHRLLAQAAVDRHLDPNTELRLAAGLFDKAEALRPKFAETHQERGASALVAARWAELQGGDPSTELKEAQSRFRLARTYNAQDAELAESLAETAWLQARWEARQRRNPAARVAEGLAAAATALKLNPRQHRARALAGALRLVRAQAGGSAAEADAAAQDLEVAFTKDPMLAVEFGELVKQAKALRPG